MTPFLESAITVACAIGSWVVAGWVTVNVIKTKMDDFIRRMESLERRTERLEDKFAQFQLDIIEELSSLRRANGGTR